MYNYEIIVEELLSWYDNNARELPWRSNPLPYYVWVSEIMLQQTRVEAVRGYFERFITELPDIKSLANAREEHLLKLWQGLGYYNRVRNLQEAAKTVVDKYGGQLPSEYEELVKLKGIGSYTAGAIASIAFGKQVPAVDGNVLRVMKRLAGSYDDILKASVKKDMEKQLLTIMPQRAGAFNQAIMDLGAMVCIPNGQPLCAKCPLSDYCVAHEKRIETQLPIKMKKKSRKIEKKTILVMEYAGKIAIRKRKNNGLLAGLWELPNISEWVEKKNIVELLKKETNDYQIKELGENKHIFTHKEWHMIGYYIKLSGILKMDDYIWVSKEEIADKYAIPTAFSYFIGKFVL
ncbi:MAG: A/G-specific adenine glycosylase [Lachnospiraceae bacterium]|nr:A/G-specific adenine glycosylase [Lachnospiraceae bacterium]